MSRFRSHVAVRSAAGRRLTLGALSCVPGLFRHNGKDSTSGARTLAFVRRHEGFEQRDVFHFVSSDTALGRATSYSAVGIERLESFSHRIVVDDAVAMPNQFNEVASMRHDRRHGLLELTRDLHGSDEEDPRRLLWNLMINNES